jgi:uncharacterized protein YecT (DUF1311 family)
MGRIDIFSRCEAMERQSWLRNLGGIGLAIGIVSLSGVAVAQPTLRKTELKKTELKKSVEMPNCAKPTDPFEQNFCQIKPNCDEMMTQLDINTCSAWFAKLSDRKLNQAYQKVRETYLSFEPKDYRELRLKDLTESQLAWIKYRDTNCKWQGSKYAGGSAESMLVSLCVDRMSQARTQELLDSLDQ